MTLVSQRLNHIAEAASLVKVHGEGVVCRVGQIPSVLVMIVVNTDALGIRYRMCNLYAGYESEGLQLCLFHCKCPENELCEEVVLKFEARSQIKICEFGVV